LDFPAVCRLLNISICHLLAIALGAHRDKFPDKQLHRLELVFVGAVKLQSKTFRILLRQ